MEKQVCNKCFVSGNCVHNRYKLFLQNRKVGHPEEFGPKIIEKYQNSKFIIKSDKAVLELVEEDNNYKSFNILFNNTIKEIFDPRIQIFEIPEKGLYHFELKICVRAITNNLDDINFVLSLCVKDEEKLKVLHESNEKSFQINSKYGQIFRMAITSSLELDKNQVLLINLTYLNSSTDSSLPDIHLIDIDGPKNEKIANIFNLSINS